jgi:protein-S-isoprenylcysteine O-methyltransferase Ste14
MNAPSDPEHSASPERLLRPTAWIVYLIIGFEILFMISPAALYFYSLYGPALNILNRWEGTAWLSQFFLPHSSTTRSPLLNALPWVGGVSAVLGAAWFLAAAGQLYWNKFRRKGLVTTGLYAFSRHPQYTALALLGLGTLLMWPRFMVLVAYVAMLFVYRYLAALEERRCEAEFGQAYRDYQARTPPILPFIPHSADHSVHPRIGFGASGAIASLVAALLIALGLREYTLSEIAAVYPNRAAVLSPALLSEQELLTAYRTALKDSDVPRLLARLGAEPLVVHVIPRNWHLADLPIDAEPSRGGHHTPANFDRRHYKILFSQARGHEMRAVGKNIVRSAYGIDPLLLVWVDVEAGRIVAIETPPTHVRWGDIPTPLF